SSEVRRVDFSKECTRPARAPFAPSSFLPFAFCLLPSTPARLRCGEAVAALDSGDARRAPLSRRAHAASGGADGLDEAVIFEASVGVAHDVAADAELFGERALGRDRVAARKLTGEYGAGDLVEDLLCLRLVRALAYAYV